MKKVIFIFFASICSLSSQTSKLHDVDKIMYSYSNINSIEELTKRIDYDFKTKLEKSRAVFTWIALNINYQDKNPNLIELTKFYWVLSDADFKRKLEKENEKILRSTFREKRGICKGFAFLFHKICTQLNIKNELIYGYVKGAINDIGYVPTNKNHVWNAVKINGEWLFVDTTWAAGIALNGVWRKKLDTSYFNIDKKNLRFTHYPSEAFWLEYLDQKPLKDFCYQPILTTVFTKSKAELVLPNDGVIKIVKNRKFKLKIKNLTSNIRIHYRYEDSKRIESPVLTTKELITSINIHGPNKSDFLYVYFNENLALTYKIEVE